MKKLTLIVAILVIILATLAVAGIVYAQTETPPNPEQPYAGSQFWGPGAGMMGSGRGMMGGRWSTTPYNQVYSGDEGPMHEYMISALAERFNLTPESLEARHEAGETMWDIAQDQGLTEEQFQDAMLQARSEAMNQAVADGVISQEQADWMLSRMNRMWQYGFGPGSGSCPGRYGDFQGRPGGWRWNR